LPPRHKDTKDYNIVFNPQITQITQKESINRTWLYPAWIFPFFGFLSIQPTHENAGMAVDNSGYPWWNNCQPYHRDA